MNKQLKKQLESAFEPPPPQHKTTFIANLNYPKASRFSFFIAQAGYISKLFWCVSILVTAGILLATWLYRDSRGAFTIAILSSCLPFLTLLGFAELKKSTIHGMSELEGCCKHSFAQVTLMRLLITGLTHAVILISLCLLYLDKTGMTPMRTVLYLTTPFLLCTGTSLAVITHLRSREALYICGGITCFVALTLIVFGTTPSFANIYSDQYIHFWIIGFVAVAALTAFGIRKFIKQTEDMQWNLPLTA